MSTFQSLIPLMPPRLKSSGDKSGRSQSLTEINSPSTYSVNADSPLGIVMLLAKTATANSTQVLFQQTMAIVRYRFWAQKTRTQGLNAKLTRAELEVGEQRVTSLFKHLPKLSQRLSLSGFNVTEKDLMLFMAMETNESFDPLTENRYGAFSLCKLTEPAYHTLKRAKPHKYPFDSATFKKQVKTQADPMALAMDLVADYFEVNVPKGTKITTAGELYSFIVAPGKASLACNKQNGSLDAKQVLYAAGSPEQNHNPKWKASGNGGGATTISTLQSALEQNWQTTLLLAERDDKNLAMRLKPRSANQTSR